MKIPKKLSLINSTFDIELKDDLIDEQRCIGQIDYLKGKIYIQPSSNTKKINPREIEQTFLHELVHGILYKMGKTELNEDEAFVDQFASILHQAFLTQKGEIILNKKGKENERSISRTSKAK